MEFEKRWVTYTIAGVWLLRKLLLFYFAIEYRIDPIDEYVNYMFDAFVLACAFASLEKYTVTRIGKSFLATITSVVFVGVIIIQNYFLDYLRFMPHSYGYGMENMVINALKRYLHYGYPGYHWAFIGMLAICFIIIALRASKPKIMNIIKDVLFQKAEKTKRSIYFTILFEHFLDYITIGEYICLKDWYLNSDIKWSMISRVFEEEEWKEMDSIIFDPVVEYLERQKNVEQSNETEPELNKKDLEKTETNESEKQKVEIIDDNNDIPSDDINKEEERLE